VRLCRVSGFAGFVSPNISKSELYKQSAKKGVYV